MQQHLEEEIQILWALTWKQNKTKSDKNKKTQPGTFMWGQI